MTKSYFQYIYICLIISSLFACERDEGLGGNASISGSITIREYNKDMTVLLDEYPAADHNVYLIFGDNSTVGKDMETSYKGDFRFDYLTPGDYEVYYYSNDTTTGSGHEEIAFSKTMTLSNKENLDLGTLFSYRFRDFNDGHAIIKGRVMLITYYKNALPPLADNDILDIVPAQDYEVYLKYGDHEGYDERGRTDYDGYFQFINLIKGDYRVYTFTKDLPGGRYEGDDESVIRFTMSNGSYQLAVYQDVTIDQPGQVVTLDNMYSEDQ
jgi:hypothetical protein